MANRLLKAIERGSFIDVECEALARHGWIMSNSPDITYFEFESVYKGNPEMTTRKSLVVRLTVDWEHRTYYLTLGTNKGDGFCNLLSVQNVALRRMFNAFCEDMKTCAAQQAGGGVDGESSTQKKKRGRLVALLKSHPLQFVEIEDAIERFEHWITGTSNAFHGDMVCSDTTKPSLYF